MSTGSALEQRLREFKVCQLTMYLYSRYLCLANAVCQEIARPLWQVGPSHSNPPAQATFHTEATSVLRI